MKSFKLVLKYLVLSVNVLVVILMILSAYSDRISPEMSLSFSYLGMMFPLICAANFFFVICWILLTEWKPLLVGIAAFVICWGPVKNYFPMHQRTKNIPTENVIKVLTYNVMAFGYEGHSKDKPNRIIQYIIDSNADIVCLQEYSVQRKGKMLSASRLRDALSMYPYRSVVLCDEMGNQEFGVAVFSKYPISNIRKVNYESDYNGSSVQTINIKGKKLTLVNNHLESFKLTTEDRTRYLSFLKGESKDHFSDWKGAIQQKLGPAFLIRARQARTVAQEIKDSKDEYVLVCGDFNDTPISYAHHTVQGKLIDSFSESGRGMGITYNRNFFYFRIDNILHSSNMKSYNCTIDKLRYSDHYPLWCYLELK
jgi:endonuclease/exonuclease/phosphatase family metal-dependent hydrolase